ncbi:MAG: hypothetical protein KKG13_03055 [Nanoarchaeota archaeon]|nr:hypothetical protein [Nanoarchaeota archaeon]
MEKNHNAQLDYSCNTDNDCVIKTAGCGICHSSYRACMNNDSMEGVCYETENPTSGCLAMTINPTSCRCVNSECEGILYCSNGQCFDMGGRPI